MYDTGKDDVLTIDHVEAAKWFKQVTTPTITQLYSNLIFMTPFLILLLSSLIVEWINDWWFEKAADKNNLESIHALALMEATGRGVEMNLPNAIKKFIKLASLDNDPPFPNAHYMLGLFALKGQIIKKLPLKSILPEEYTQSYHEIMQSGKEGGGSEEERKRMNDLVLGVKLIRYASELGHPQATDQLEQLMASLEDVETPEVLADEL